ncbi:MAG TPA: LLM class flavin-dependent oxidoreductase [Methylomirabilota bacterium]
MRLGYFAMPLHPPGADPAQTLDDDLEQLAFLDRLGYEERERSMTLLKEHVLRRLEARP